MSKSEELKDRINHLKGFLTLLLGRIVLICSGLISLHTQNQVDDIFWLGCGVTIVILFACFKVMLKIERHLQQPGRI